MSNPPLIRKSPVPPDQCNLAKSFDELGDRWSLLILRAALYGVRRFDDFQAELEIPRSVLTLRLAALVGHDLLAKSTYRDEGQRARTEYVLTEKGRDLRLPFLAMTEWGDKWLGQGQAPMTLRSKSKGQKLSIALVDEVGRAVREGDIETVIAAPIRRRTKAQPLPGVSRKSSPKS